MTEYVSPYLVLQARAEARALLFACCAFDDLDQALQPLFGYALENSIVDDIGADATWAILKAAFADHWIEP